MKILHFALILLLLSVFSAFADKKMTIRNAETGESFEVSVPDGLKIYEYNSNWLDSIPYLLERARYGEPWAYEALGDCYRYGKGGVERSIFKALTFYYLADINIDKFALDLIESNPEDPIGLIYKLSDKLLNHDRTECLCLLDTLNEVGYSDAEIIRYVWSDSATVEVYDVVAAQILLNSSSTDKMLFALAGINGGKIEFDNFRDNEQLFWAIPEKFPYLFNLMGEKSCIKYIEEQDLDKNKERRARILRYFGSADKHGVLTRENAKTLYNLYVEEFKDGRMKLDKKNMERLAILARLPESETFIFTDK